MFDYILIKRIDINVGRENTVLGLGSGLGRPVFDYRLGRDIIVFSKTTGRVLVPR